MRAGLSRAYEYEYWDKLNEQIVKGWYINFLDTAKSTTVIKVTTIHFPDACLRIQYKLTRQIS